MARVKNADAIEIVNDHLVWKMFMNDPDEKAVALPYELKRLFETGECVSIGDILYVLAARGLMSTLHIMADRIYEANRPGSSRREVALYRDRIEDKIEKLPVCSLIKEKEG